MASPGRRVAIGIFALLAVVAPLAFGAADRSVQVVLVTLFGIGLLVTPPEIPRLSPRGMWILAALAAVFLVKEFAPFALFGPTSWRQTLTQDFSLKLPWTHNPEPGRALDGLFSLAVGAVWFAWVRTLAGDRDIRPGLAWSMVVAGALLAVTCLVMRAFPHAENMIYGIRYTPGWAGFGPFPNRNHTACFLAMSALIGCGCVARAGARGRRDVVAIGIALIVLVLFAMLQSRSRGGLVGFVVGLAVLGALVIFKMRDRKTVSTVLAGGLIVATLCMIFGTNVLARFGSAHDGDIPTNLRWSIWRDALAMWRDAPIFGHGLGTFAQLFPMYQTLKLEDLLLDNQAVVHPESSWLLALVEAGALIMLAAVVLLALFVSKNVRATLASERSFFLRAGGFAACSALLVQSLWDVPAHRWAVMGFGLAALALACPLSSRTPRLVPGAKFAPAVFALALFWSLPFFTNGPLWSPAAAKRLLLRNTIASANVTVADFDAALRWLPLSADLHYVRGARAIMRPGGMQRAWQDFRIASRLRPSSWNLPAAAASMAKPVSSGMSEYFWARAVQCSGARGESVLLMGWRNTAGMPDSELFWTGFAETNPQYLLSLAANDPNRETAQRCFDLWWKTRAFAGKMDRLEIENFYRCLPQFGRREQLDEWMNRRRDLEPEDFKRWASLLHDWSDDQAAWKLLAGRIGDPQFPSSLKQERPEILESRYQSDATDWVNAQQLAQLLARNGKPERANKIITDVAAAKNAPPWFVEKAAYFLAAEGRYSEAVTSLLREK